MKAPLKIDWLKLEQEIREVLRDPDMEEQDALDCISAILGWHTSRGYERFLGIPEECWDDNVHGDYDLRFEGMKNRFPLYFDRID